jgi:hypothetical protein
MAVIAKAGSAKAAEMSITGRAPAQAPRPITASTPRTAITEAAMVARSEPETSASRGIATSQTAAGEAAPPVTPASATTIPVSPAEETAWASQREPVRASRTAARTGSSRLAIARTSMPDGTPRQRR